MSDLNDPRKVLAEQTRLKQAYRDIQKSAAMEHFLKWLGSQQTQARGTAETEMDNPVRRSLYLQDAIAYAKVRAHLDKMFTDDAQGPK